MKPECLACKDSKRQIDKLSMENNASKKKLEELSAAHRALLRDLETIFWGRHRTASDKVKALDEIVRSAQARSRRFLGGN